MSFNLIIEEKRAWNQLNKQVKAMPKDYQFVYKEIQKYIFKVATLNSNEALILFAGLIELFETGIEVNKKVLEVTGEDVAEFCDNLIVDNDNFDQHIKNIIDRSINSILKTSDHKLDELNNIYGQGNLKQVYSLPASDKMWAIGVTVSNMVSPVGVLASGVKPVYYLYKQEKIIKVIGDEVSEHLVHQQQGEKYLADNNWYTTSLQIRED